MYLQPGEYVMRKSAVQAIGRENLDRVNFLGNNAISATGAMPMPMPTPREPDKVNVFVVSPDQAPQMGPKDVVAHITQDIEQRGQVFRLIKTVAVGG
jgi:hypothetical protein